jgi:hypothetical protein
MVVVHQGVKTQWLYLHSVTTKENLLQPGQSSANAFASGRSGTVATGGARSVLHSALTFKEDVSKVVDAEVCLKLRPGLRHRARGVNGYSIFSTYWQGGRDLCRANSR